MQSLIPLHPSCDYQIKVCFFLSFMPTKDLQAKRKLFSHLFSDDENFDELQLKFFVNEVKKIEFSIKEAKIFSGTISIKLTEQLVEDIEGNENHPFSEQLRAYIVLRFCDESTENIEYSKLMKNARVSSEIFQYKFACHCLQRHGFPEDSLDNFTINNLQLRRQVADKLLAVRPSYGLKHINEFGFLGYDEVSTEFAIRTYARTIDGIDDTSIEDYGLMDVETIPVSVLQLLYNNVHFGQQIIQKIISETHSTKSESEHFAQLFVAVSEAQNQKDEEKPLYLDELKISPAAPGVSTLNEGQTFSNEESSSTSEDNTETIYDFLLVISESEKNSLIATILFLNYLKYFVPLINTSSSSSTDVDISETSHFFKMVNVPSFLNLLREIHSFPDPTARFAVIGIFCEWVKRGKVFGEIFGDAGDPNANLEHPTIYSIIKFSLKQLNCHESLLSIFTKKWKDIQFRKNLVYFVAELLFVEKLKDKERLAILSNILNTKELQNSMAIIEFTFCLRKGYYKPLINGENPRIVLSTQVLTALSALGAPYQIALEANLTRKLLTEQAGNFVQNIGYYVGSLGRLPELLPRDDKADMVRFFFRFLNLTLEEKMRDARYKTTEIKRLVLSCNFNLQVWRTNESSTVQEIIAQYGMNTKAIQEKFTPNGALRKSFDEDHLSKADYELFFHAAFVVKNVSSFQIEPKEYGKLINQVKADSTNVANKRKVILHLFCKLLSGEQASHYISTIKQLIHYFPENTDFYLDLNNWLKTLHRENQIANCDYGSYQIVKSDDPYLLFGVGSLGGDTCQRVTGDPAKNKCLLAYPCDGKNQLLYAQKPDGGIEARAILRLFHTHSPRGSHQIQSPVLYLEPFYPGGTPAVLRDAMTFLAIECAKKLSVPLVRHLKINEENNDVFPFDLKTISGPAPFEYFDGIESEHGKIVMHSQESNDSSGSETSDSSHNDDDNHTLLQLHNEELSSDDEQHSLSSSDQQTDDEENLHTPDLLMPSYGIIYKANIKWLYDPARPDTLMI